MVRKNLASLIAAAGLALGAAAPAQAAITVYNLFLSGNQEAPVNNSAGMGSATITVDDVLNTLRLQVSFAGLSGNTTNAHIHCCTSTPLSGTTGVATTTPSFAGFPSGVTAVTVDQTYDMTLASSYNAAFITANGGTPTSAFSVLKTGMATGLAYLNIHTTAFPGGEIRSFVTLTPVPEASTWAMMGLGLLAVGGLARRREVV